MRFLIAPDSFKGSLSAKKVANKMETGIKKVIQKAEVIKFPIADGGEGTLETLINANQGVIMEDYVRGPLSNQVLAKYGYFHHNNKKIGVVEMAQASGLTLLSYNERNPLLTTTFGTGELIEKLLDHKCNKIIVGLGGSATNDGGIGMAQALGSRFYGENNCLIGEGGVELIKINRIDTSGLDQRINDTEFIIASDVSNTLCGSEGATFVYGRQKGASEDMLIELEKGMYNYGKMIKRYLNIDILNIKGAGAAGGLGGGLIAFLKGNVQNGFDIIKKYSQLENEVKLSDYILTGEGYTDAQTLYGKAPYSIATLAKKYNKKVICISGGVSYDSSELFESNFDLIFSCTPSPMDLSEAIKNVEHNIELTTSLIIRAILLNET